MSVVLKCWVCSSVFTKHKANTVTNFSCTKLSQKISVVWNDQNTIYLSKCKRLGGLNYRNLFFSQFWRLEVHQGSWSSVRTLPSLQTAAFWLHSYMHIYRDWWNSLLSLLIRTNILLITGFTVLPSSNLNYFLTLIAAILVDRASVYEFWEKEYISIIVLFLIGFHVSHNLYIIHKSIGYKKAITK